MERIPIDRVESSALFSQWVAGDNRGLEELLGGFDRRDDRWRRAVERPAPADAAPVYERLVEYNRGLGAGRDLLDGLEAAARGEARIVVTGQQPGPVGGPLMTLYKVATAVVLAARLAESHGVTVVPVYWMGADDADFAEIRELVLPGEDLSPLASSIANDAHSAAAPVGGIPVDAIARLWGAVAPLLSGLPGYGRAESVVNEALTHSRDHAGVTARTISALFGGGVAVVDGREPLLRENARDLILRFFDEEDDVRRAVTDRGTALESAGFHAQLEPGADSGVFLLEGGVRRKIAPDAREAARGHLERSITDASPGVILRNLVQDSVFQPAAVVLGPAEVAYRAQIADLYPRFGLERPIAFPRLFATWLPSPVDGLARTLAMDPASIVLDPPALVSAARAAATDTATSDAARRLRDAFAESRAAFVEELSTRLDERDRVKLEKRLGDVERRLSQAIEGATGAAADAALTRWPFLAHVGDLFERRGARQERFLSALSPLLHAGEGAAQAVLDAADAHVEGAMDGCVEHIVYST